MKRALVVVVLLSASRLALAEVQVRIADYPEQVYSYSPVIITGVIENHGSEAVLLPASLATENRYFIETGTTMENLKELMPFRFDGGGNVVWVRPGEKWYFQMGIGQWSVKLSGTLYIRMGIRSTGRCHYFPQGDEEFPLKLLSKNGSPVYECWEGHVRSDVASIDFVRPDSVADQAAADYIYSPEFPTTCNLESNDGCLHQGASQLLERFPASHYTYVALLTAGTDSPEYLQKALDLQPSHPLTPYTTFQKALALVRLGRTTEVSFEALDIPSALRDYLMQEKTAEEKRQRRAVSHQAARPD